MTYATLQNLTDRYGEAMLIALTDRGDLATETVHPEVVTPVLIDTDAVIDGYLAARYALPLVATPVMLADLAKSIAIWKLHTSEPDPKIKADYDAAMRTLRDIADGRVRIPGVAGVQPAAIAGSGARITDREREMTPETLKGFI